MKVSDRMQRQASCTGKGHELDVDQSATTLKPPTGEVINFDHLGTMQSLLLNLGPGIQVDTT